MKAGSANSHSPYYFLAGGGEAASLILEHNWSATQLGTPGQWPLSLRTTLGLMLHSALPMFLFWGADADLVCFYNDAYRPGLGNNGKHPAIGQKARVVWSETWDIIGPLIKQVITTGEPCWYKHQLAPIFRNGQMEDVYRDFCYSPAFGDDGEISGVLGVCTETTATIDTLPALKQSEQRFQNLVREASVGIIVLTGPEMKVEIVNEAYGRLINHTPEELTGQHLFDLIPDAQAAFRPLLEEVLRTGKPMYQYDTPYLIWVKGEKKEGFLHTVYQPYKEKDGAITGVMVLGQDVTAQVLARKAVEASEAKFRALIQAAPVGIVSYKGRDLIIEEPNQTFIDIVGKGWDIVGKPLYEAMPELITEGQPFLNILDEVFTTGIPFSTSGTRVDVLKNGVLRPGFYDFSYTPLRNAEGAVYGILNVAKDVTEETAARKKLEESELFSRSVIQNSPIAKIVFTGPQMMVTTINDGMLQILGRDLSIIGQPFLQAMPELAEAGLYERYMRVITTGETYTQPEEPIVLIRNGMPYNGYYNYIYKALHNTDGNIYGVICTATEVTSQVAAREYLQRQKAYLQNAIEIANLGTYSISLTNNYGEISENVRDWFGMQSLSQSMDAINERIHPQDLPLVTAAIMASMQEEAQSHHDITYRITEPHSTAIRYLRSMGKVQFAGGKPALLNGILQDVTAQVVARQKVEEAEASLRGAIELAELGTWEINMITRILDYSPRARAWFGIGPDEVITVERAYEPVREADRPRVRAAIFHAINPGSDGIYDIEYAIDTRAGYERILHAQGKAFFNEKQEAYKISGTIQDVTEIRLRQQELERLVQQRTAELATQAEALETANRNLLHSNEELAQYAYVASHDLQEPLRKIRMFSGMLESHKALPDENKALVSKIAQSAKRMSLLIKDLLEFSRLLKSETLVRPVSLQEVVQSVAGDFELTIAEKHARLHVGAMPVIHAIALQMNQLFHNLLGNALKFSRADTPPVIRISSEEISQQETLQHIPRPLPFARYYRISVSDNGIGFEGKYADQIFEVFKRLHSRDAFPGSGIGLALCRRIADNHQGHLYAESATGEGTTFYLILPDRQQEQLSTVPTGVE